MSTELPRTFKVVTSGCCSACSSSSASSGCCASSSRCAFAPTGDIIEIRRGPDGHYHWPGTINGRSVDFLIDTGATGTAISAALARELELQSIGQVQSSTAGGPVTGAGGARRRRRCRAACAPSACAGRAAPARRPPAARHGRARPAALAAARRRDADRPAADRSRPELSVARRVFAHCDAAPPNGAPTVSPPPMHNERDNHATTRRHHGRRSQLREARPGLRFPAGPGQERRRRAAEHRPVGRADARIPRSSRSASSELRTVQFWLEQNARMLGATIQALEVQRMTLSTLKTMNVQMEDLRESLQIRMPGLAVAGRHRAALGRGSPRTAAADAEDRRRAARRARSRTRRAAENRAAHAAATAADAQPAGMVDPHAVVGRADQAVHRAGRQCDEGHRLRRRAGAWPAR